MSDQSQGPGWWMASDGKYYAPEQRPAVEPPAAPSDEQPGSPVYKKQWFAVVATLIAVLITAGLVVLATRKSDSKSIAASASESGTSIGAADLGTTTSDASPTTFDETRSLRGQVIIRTLFYSKDGVACSGVQPITSDLQPGEGVVVRDEGGLIIGSTSLQAGSTVIDPQTADQPKPFHVCSMPFEVRVTQANFYQIEIGRRPAVTLAEDTMSIAGNFTITING